MRMTFNDNTGNSSSIKLNAVHVFAMCYAIFESLHLLPNFLPSTLWITLSVVFPIVTLFFIPGIKVELPSSKLAATILAFALWVTFFITFAYGGGRLATAFFHTIVEKDIAGTKDFAVPLNPLQSRYSLRMDYIIKSKDLPEANSLCNFYITTDEYHSIPDNVRMHVVFKQSFFGSAVKSYTFIK